MAKENIVFGIDIETGKAAQSFSGIKTELKALTKAIGEIDPNSNAFEVATKRAGQLRDQIRGVNDAIENADPEKKFAPFARTVQGLAGGFAAVQGAMGLMGAESEDLEKALLKVQSAMALSQGLNSLLAFKNDFKDLGKLIINQVVKSFTTLRGALIATGIGAAAIAVGLLAANWDAVVKAVRTFIGLGPTTKELLEAENKSLSTQEKLLALNSDKYDEFTKRKLQANLDYKKSVQENAKAVEEGTMTEYEANAWNAREYDKLKRTIAQADKDRAKSTADYNKDLAEKAEKKQKEFLEKKLEAEKQHELDLAEWRKEADERKKKEDKKRDDEYLALQKKLQVDLPKQFSQEQINNIKYSKSVKQKLDEEETAAKIAQLQMISSALSGYAQLLGQQTAAGKALAVAQTSIDTYISASAAFKNVMQSPLSKFMPDGGLSLAIIAAGGAVAAGIANVRRIVSVQVPGGGGGGNTAPSAGGSQSVPQFNPAVAQQVQGGGDVQLGMKPQKVYVVESDIRGTMNKVDVIEANATIG
jgi:hypothetical protein